MYQPTKEEHCLENQLVAILDRSDPEQWEIMSEHEIRHTTGLRVSALDNHTGPHIIAVGAGDAAVALSCRAVIREAFFALYEGLIDPEPVGEPGPDRERRISAVLDFLHDNAERLALRPRKHR